MQLWRVVGGSAHEGIIVRSACELSSPQEKLRLQTGALVQAKDIRGDRLLYELVDGIGPRTGWVSTRLKHRDLLVKAAPPVRSDARQQNRNGNFAQANSPAPAGYMQKHVHVGGPKASVAPALSVQMSHGNKLGHDSDVFVKVVDLAGEEMLSISFPETATILSVKERLASVCKLPPERQHLLNLQANGDISKDDAMLRDNVRLPDLGKRLSLQLVRLTERSGVIRMIVRGMWSLGGRQCKLVATPETTWGEIKLLIARDLGVLVESQELQLPDGKTCPDDDATCLEDLSAADRDSETPVTVYLFARAHPDRAELLRQLGSGQITVKEILALDPDCLMPAC